MSTATSTGDDERYLPPEVLTEVLARLPVKSIFRFRCVSKYWLHRIPNPTLISLHLHRITDFKLTSFTPTSRILTVEYAYKSEHFLIRSVQNFREYSPLTTAPPPHSAVVSNDGLVLTVDDVNNPKVLTLVNPTLDKTLVLPPCPIPLTNHRIVYVMGFAPTANDFKVYVFRIPPSHSDAQFSAVYSLNRGCWTAKDVDFDKDYMLLRRMVLFTKGKAHWWSKCHGHLKVVTFDIDAEKFSYFGLPLECVDRVDGRKIHTVKHFFSLRGSVAIWYFSYLGLYIWVLDEVGDGGDPMWTRLYHGVPSLDTTDFFSHIRSLNKFWFDDERGKFYILAEYELLSYDFRRDQIEHLGCSYQRIWIIDTYVESLLLCSQPGMDQPRA